MKLAIISEGFQLWPLYVADVRGFFTAAGADVEVILTGASGPQMEALMRGEYDVGLQQSDHVVRAVEKGSDLFIFMANAPQPDLTLAVAPAIRDVAGLRGRTIAVDGLHSGYSLLLRKLLATSAMRENDYTLVAAGGVRERHDALRSGRADAAWLNPPFDGWLLAEGFGSLGRAAELFPGYPGSTAAARRSWARANAERLTAFIRAFDRAYAWLLDPANRRDAESIAMARLGSSREQTERAYLSFTAMPRAAIGPDTLRQVIDMVWEADGYAPPPGAPEKYLDLEYLARARRQ